MKNLDDFIRPTQKKLFKLLCKKFKGKTTFSKGNFILIRGTAPVMLVAHLDTVHTEPVRQICASENGKILMSPQGIGGDNSCGVFALVKIYQSTQIKPWLLFTCDEEIGGLGAHYFCQLHSQGFLQKDLDSLKFLIEIDQRGSNDAVFYYCDNSDFEDYITGKGFQTALRSFSDISLLAPNLGLRLSISQAAITTLILFTSISLQLNLITSFKESAKSSPKFPNCRTSST